MPSPDETVCAGSPRTETTEGRLGRWECLVIKCFAILFLILFLSEKAVKEAGSIRRSWASEITAPVEGSGHGETGCSCSRAQMNGACCHRDTTRPTACLQHWPAHSVRVPEQ